MWACAVRVGAAGLVFGGAELGAPSRHNGGRNTESKAAQISKSRCREFATGFRRTHRMKGVDGSSLPRGLLRLALWGPALPAEGSFLGSSPFCPFCAAPLIAQPVPSVHEERKVVTVLSCDLVGFTAASDAADPEDVRARMLPYYARLRSEIERYGGAVQKFIGDAVMAAFGAPVTHEDDAERAVRAGLRILDAIEELNADDPRLDLSVRIGIHTGEVVVSLGASPDAGEGAVLGDVVNAASGMRGGAGERVACSEQTYRATERVFVCGAGARWR